VPEDDCADPTGTPTVFDQRLEPRATGASDRCDIGAYEVQP